MLPPVLASANQFTTATEAKQRPDQIAAARPTTVSQVGPSARIDQNSAIAGQLNIMLLSGPERMSQNLAALADVLGSALKIERRAEESLNDYMGRLIEGIAALPAGDRAKLQKLLSQAFAGLQLRTLLEAMANPSGPERATLALYLELYRQKDGDGATRSVISSYRELAGEGRSHALNSGRPAAANDSLRPVVEPAPSAAKAVSQTPLAPSTLSLDSQKLGEGRPSLSNALQDTRTSSAPLRSQALGGAPTGPQRQGAELPLDTTALKPAPMPGAARGMLETAPALPAGRGLSPSADRVAQPQVSGLASLSGSRPPELRSEQRGDTTGASAKASPLASPMPMPMLEPGAKPAPQASGWLAELLETDIVRTLLALKSLSADHFRAQSQAAGLNRTTAEPSPPHAATVPEGPTEETELGSRMQEAGQTSEATETETAPPPLPLAEQAVIRPTLAREGVPLPFVSYMIEDEVQWEEEIEDEDEREAEDQGQPQDEDPAEGEEPSDQAVASAETEDQPAGHVAAPALPHGDVMRHRALPAPSDTAMQLPPEPAHELYLRMAGLN